MKEYLGTFDKVTTVLDNQSGEIRTNEGAVSHISDDQSNRLFRYLTGVVYDYDCCQKYIDRAWRGASFICSVNMEAPRQVQQQLPARGRGGRRRGRGGVRMRGGIGGRGRGARRHHDVPDEIRATLIDHVINHRLTMAEAGRRVQPNVPRSTVSSIIQTFRRENRIGRQPQVGGRRKLLNEQQEQEICNMVIANNAITLRQIRNAILLDNVMFQNINSISISTIDWVLKKHQMTMKQIYRVPFKRNSARVKGLRYQYVHRIMALEGNETPHILVFVDEAGFNLAKGRRRGRNIIGHRATVDVPGQRGANITMCAAISERGVATHIPSLGPYNTQKLLNFLDHLYTDLIPENERGVEGPQLPHYVIVWDNVNFHRGPRIRTWFTTHPWMLMEFLPPYSPFLNPIEEFFQLGGGGCMSIRLKTRGPCCMQWMLHVRTSQGINVGDG
ncbi:uncharacterized protein LOC120528320 isoform X1 [Polypterus senegalus]|uniref:uncharacterized protein LOC120528320 isoform X1 n=1 Tax=Polypterus senegalus TaxID=55291 RepID=UPI001963A9AE|nr:uncharacterized protein LOC120528320 isoform X1 [Polypterus senegalus]